MSTVSNKPKHILATKDNKMPRTFCVPRGHRCILRYLYALLTVLSCTVTNGRDDTDYNGDATGNEIPRILVLHSCQSGSTCSKAINSGITKKVHEFSHPVDLCFAYLDAHRISTTDYYENQSNLLRAKYADKPVDVIITVGNPTLAFITEYDPELFPGSPLVFCSVISFDSRIKEERDVTGLIHEPGIQETLEAALKLEPDTSQIYVTLNTDARGLNLKKEAESVFRKFKNRLKFIFLEDLTLKQLQEKTSALPEDSIVLAFSFSKKTGRQVLSHEKSIELFRSRCSAPIYSTTEPYLGSGIVGGHLTAGEKEGELAAEKALRILRGEQANDIPIDQSPTHFAFDFEELSSFGLPLNRLPKDAIIINRPFSFIREYFSIIIIAALICVILIASIAALALSNTIRKKSLRALRASQRRYSRLFHKSSDAIFIHDIEGNITDANEKALDMLGYNKGELLRLHISDLHPDDDLQKSSKAFDTIKDKGTVTFNIDIKRKDGSIFHSLITSGTFKSNSHVMIQGIVRDITEQAKYEKALKESEVKYRTLIETLPYAVTIVQNNSIVFANPATIEMLKAEKEEDILGKNFLEVINDSDRDRISNYAKARKENRKEEAPEHYFVKLKRLNGEIFPVEVFARRIEYAGATATQMVGIDISKRLANQEERARLASAVEQAAECIMITDPQGQIKYVNPCFETMTGYTAEEAIEKTPDIISSGRHSESFYKMLWKTISSGNTWRGTFVNRKKDGSLFEEEAVISPVMDNNKKIVNYVAVKRNITYEKILENQIRHSQKMAAMGHLAHRITHTYTNALTRILGNAQIAQAKLGDSSEVAPYLKEVVDASNEVTGLAAELLAFAHPSQPKIRKIGLNKLLVGIEEILKKALTPEINLEFEPTAGKHKINADASQLEQAITHMAINAMEAMPDGGTLKITTQVESLSPEEVAAIQAGIPKDKRHMKGFGAILIADTGKGMTSETMAHIFEPFFTTKENERGAGLGLSTAYRIIDQHKGHIITESTPGSGTTFKVFLPLADS